jgi:hypothetical protein
MPHPIPRCFDVLGEPVQAEFPGLPSLLFSVGLFFGAPGRLLLLAYVAAGGGGVQQFGDRPPRLHLPAGDSAAELAQQSHLTFAPSSSTARNSSASLRLGGPPR